MYDKKKLAEILVDDDCRTIDETGKIYPPTNSVYSVISEKMELSGSPMTPRHIYTILNNNRNGFQELVLKTFSYKTEPQNSSNYSMSEDSSACIELNDSVATLATDHFEAKCLKLILSASNWQEISPRKIVCTGRVYWKFQKGWTDVIAERLCQQHSVISCVFSFKNNNVTPSSSAQYYATFNGECVECNSTIIGSLMKAPERDVDVIFNIQIREIDTTKHSGEKRRQLRGARRVKVATLMIDQKKDAVTFGREEAKRLKKFGGKSVSIIPKTAVLRKAKEQQLLKNHGLEFANAPLNLLQEASHGKFAGSIHHISLLRFCCIYWSPEQQQLYAARSRDPNAILTIDATGGIEKRSKKEDPHVFLYQCMIVTSAGSVPVFQMVSADHRSFVIAFFLRYILAKGARRPPVVVSDFGRAIVNAVAEIFGGCRDLAQYLQKCYDAIFNQSTELPDTYLRLDVSHIIKMVSSWPCLKGIVIAARRLYLRCIGQAYQMYDIDTLASFLEAILAVALSEFLGQGENGEDVPSQSCMQLLNSTIAGQTEVTRDDDSKEDCEDKDVGDTQATQPTEWTIWANNIFKAAEEIGKKSKNGSVINGCYNPLFAKDLHERLMPFLPMWTGVMRPHFRRGLLTATSASVEGEFANIKKRVFGKLPIKIDRFVLEHLTYLDGRIIESSNEADLPPGKLSTILTTSPHDKVQDMEIANDIIHSTLLSQPLLSPPSANVIADTTNLRSPSSTLPPPSPNMIVDIVNTLPPSPSLPTSSPTFTDSPEEMNLPLPPSSSKMVTDVVHLLRSSPPLPPCSPTFTDSPEEMKLPLPPLSPKKNTDIVHQLPSSPPLPPCSPTFTDSPEKRNLWIECEDWRGLGVEKKRRKPTYLDKVPDWEYIKDAPQSKLPIFKNGSFCGPATTVNVKKLNLRNTCAFDSVIQIAINGLATNESYLQHMLLNSTKNETIKLALKVISAKKKLSQKHYNARAQILSNIPLFNFTVKGQKTLDTECNSAHLAEYLFYDVPSYIKSVTCDCGQKLTINGVMLSVNVDILLSKGFGSMQLAVDDGATRLSTCRRCKKTNNDVLVYGPHILIDTSIVTDHRYTTRNHDIHHDLDSIASVIAVQGATYILTGVSNWTPGHYIAYVKSGLYWYEYNDVGPTRKSVTGKKRITPHFIMYTVR